MVASDIRYVVKALEIEAAEPWTIDEARRSHERTAEWLTPADMRSGVTLVEERQVEDVRARIYWPTVDDSPRPTLLWFHGGGWMTGSLQTGDIIARALASAADVVVVTPAYRLAPEHPWPSGLDDARATLRWIFRNIDSLGGDRSQIIVGGDSAGGNLAAILSHESRGNEPGLAAQVLIYPVLDLDHTSAEYASRSLLAKGYHLELEDFVRCVTTYLPEGADVSDPAISPIRSTTFSGLPPTLLATADLDLLRDEAALYVRKLQDAGVPVQYLNISGLVHGGFDMLGVSPTARSAMAELVHALNHIVKS